MQALVTLVLAMPTFATPPSRTHESSRPGINVLEHEPYGIFGYFQRLQTAAAKPSAGGVGVSDSTTSHDIGIGLASQPAAASDPMLKFDASFFLRDADPETEFAALLEAELAAQATNLIPGKTFSYVLCGPQETASAVRDALTAVTGEIHHTVRVAGTATCGKYASIDARGRSMQGKDRC